MSESQAATNAAETVTGILGMYVDVTERTRIEGAPHEEGAPDSSSTLPGLGRAVG
jgi:hypothetical protein